MTKNDALRIANQMIGKSVQSTVLTMISNCGQKKIPQPKQKVTGYEILDLFGGCQLMLIIGGESVLYETCYNY